MSEARICPHCRNETVERTCPHDGFQTVDAAQYAEPDPAALIGTVFEDRYRIEEMIGEGGMGAVYRATQLTVNRQIALKILHQDLAKNLTMVARFQQEARAVAALSHPHIIGLIDFGQAGDKSLYLAMEFLEGEPLSERMHRDGCMSIPQTTDIALQVLEALVEAHSQGIIHRDLKPENLFLTRMGRKDDFVKVLDFGIAKVSGDLSTNLTLTGTGIAIGTPAYISPEQARATEVTTQSDLYSLAAILYEMLTGERLFNAKTATDFLMAHAKDEAPLPTLNGVEIRGPLVDLIMDCLEKAPEDRPDSAVTAIERLSGTATPGLSSVTSSPAAGPLSEPTESSGLTAPVPLTTGAQDPIDVGVTTAERGVERSWLTMGLIAAGILVGLSIATFLPQTEGEDAQVTAEERPTETPPPSVQPAPSVAPAAKKPAVEPAPTEVPEEPAKKAGFVVRVDSEPSGAEVRRGEEVLGITPLPVKWSQGEEPPPLVLELNGRIATVSLKATQDGSNVTVLLPPGKEEISPRAAPQKKKTGTKAKRKKKKKPTTGDDEFKMLD